MKPSIKPKQKVKVKTKSLVLPVVSSCFLFAIIISITLNGDLISFMGNSVLNNSVCNDGYELDGNRCVVIIDAIKSGDVNKDGIIDSSDVSIIKDYVDGNSFLDNTQIKAADVNLDGSVSFEDVNKLKFYLAGVTDIDGYICPNDYELDNNKCIKSYSSTKVSNSSYKIGNSVLYNDSYWYILESNDDYLTLLKKDYIDLANDYDSMVYNESEIKNVLNNYISDISNDLKEIDGSKVRLINMDELINLGFTDKTDTNYYEGSDKTPYWIGLLDGNYWVDNSNKNTINNQFMVVNYEGNNYVFENTKSNYAYIRPVINLYKSALK